MLFYVIVEGKKVIEKYFVWLENMYVQIFLLYKERKSSIILLYEVKY